MTSLPRLLRAASADPAMVRFVEVVVLSIIGLIVLLAVALLAIWVLRVPTSSTSADDVGIPVVVVLGVVAAALTVLLFLPVMARGPFAHGPAQRKGRETRIK